MYAAVDPEIVQKNIHGQYLEPMCKVSQPRGVTDESCQKLWTWTQDYLKAKGFDGKWNFESTKKE